VTVLLPSEEAEPGGPDPRVVGRRRARLELGVAARLERGRHADPGARGDRAHLLRRLEDLRPVLGIELGDHQPSALGVCFVPERVVSIRQPLGLIGPCLMERDCFAHLGCLR